jgi:hypothetical protein
MKYSTIAVLVLTLLTGSAYASQTSIDTSSLTDAQIAQLKADAAAIQATNLTTPALEITDSILDDPERITKYAEMGEAIAKGLGAAAKELGMAADDFLGTNAGMLVAILIVYNFIGAQMITMFVGFFVILPLLFLGLRQVLYWIRLKEYTYDEKGKRRSTFSEMKGSGGDVDMSSVVWAYIVWAVVSLLVTVIALPM